VVTLTEVIVEEHDYYQIHKKISSNILRRNRSTTDQIFCLRQILGGGKKREHNGTVHQLFLDFNVAYDSVRREVLCNIIIEFGIPMKLVRLFEMYSRDSSA
jgi:hypothetical protein